METFNNICCADGAEVFFDRNKFGFLISLLPVTIFDLVKM
ncbi:hypothetical protein CJA_1228 [Cellvibrio japonicus Ueda107]|uniref:Uncharacterized protein n=1 Tax=Cellvibrio japonicus (strain Ueda107) TaxID=498211 RepID=B3PCB3_CELJU|nr:hypothetical protein CJA_1228 [Cellvibrio japonicus Ueda107]